MAAGRQSVALRAEARRISRDWSQGRGGAASSGRAITRISAADSEASALSELPADTIVDGELWHSTRTAGRRLTFCRALVKRRKSCSTPSTCSCCGARMCARGQLRSAVDAFWKLHSNSPRQFDIRKHSMRSARADKGGSTASARGDRCQARGQSIPLRGAVQGLAKMAGQSRSGARHRRLHSK
jgi:hypothetical protein